MTELIYCTILHNLQSDIRKIRFANLKQKQICSVTCGWILMVKLGLSGVCLSMPTADPYESHYAFTRAPILGPSEKCLRFLA